MSTQTKNRVNNEIKNARFEEGIPHKLEWVREWNDNVLINDSKSSDLESTMYALEAIQGEVVWIMANPSWEYDYEPIQEWLSGSQTAVFMMGNKNRYVENEVGNFAKYFDTKPTLIDVLSEVKSYCENKKNVTILFSPACTTFDLYEDFRARGEDFKTIVKNW